VIALGLDYSYGYLTEADSSVQVIINGQTSTCDSIKDNSFKDYCPESSESLWPYMAFKFSKDSVVSSVMLAASEATYLIKGYIYVSKELFHGIGNSALPLTMDAATINDYELCAGPV
jgi:hypothetical protein